MNIALFGGSFDPPHNGHVSIVNEALSQLDIQELIIIPAYLNPFKSHSVAPAELRLKWLKESIKDSRVKISDYEIKQHKKVPSIESVKHFKSGVDKLYFIIGADNLKNLSSWYAFKELESLLTWVVVTRDDIDIDKRYICLHVNEPISSTQLREKPKKEHLPKEIANSVINYYKEYYATTH